MKKILLLCISLYAIPSSLHAAGETLYIDTPAQNDVISGGDILISGRTSCPYAVIRLSINSVLIATVTSEVNGTWSYTYSPALVPGEYVVKAQIINGQFTILAEASNSFTAI
jgi:hypothetical protein